MSAPVSDHERHNRAFWDDDADAYQAAHGEALHDAPAAWGVWRIPESALGVLGDVAARDVLELGCGAAQWSIALVPLGARVIGFDQSQTQLVHAVSNVRAAGVHVPLLAGGAEHLPFAAASFDLVFCDHGALSFADPAAVLPEVARVLRTGGRLVFCHSTRWAQVNYSKKQGGTTNRLQHS